MGRRWPWQGSLVAAALTFAAALTGAVPRDAADIGGRPGAPGAAPPATGAPLPVALLAATARAPSPDLIALGKRVYQSLCAACHGSDGRGDVQVAHLLNPKPRDFVAGRYALVSTWDRVPTDEDLFCTISRGMPGSAMPPFGSLSEEERWGLVYYMKSFAEKPLEVQPPTDPKGDGQPGTGVIRVPPEPPFTPEARTRALELYADGCATCHGKTGKGDGVQGQRDERGSPTQPRDLTTGVFKGGPDPTDLYRRIIAGMPGTPMPMNDWAYGDEAWHLVHLIRSWSSPGSAQSSEPAGKCGSPR